ncbi:MAG: hypothetical protein HYV63_11060 [Candidatus Schekmanbacteria bacterium]|nr:hypothetical protein [Candidatus Schekmanbacteria bacterium]
MPQIWRSGIAGVTSGGSGPAAAALLAGIFLIACGNKAGLIVPPLPDPAPIADLTVAVTCDAILVGFTPPTVTVRGEALRKPLRIEIQRRQEPEVARAGGAAADGSGDDPSLPASAPAQATPGSSPMPESVTGEAAPAALDEEPVAAAASSEFLTIAELELAPGASDPVLYVDHGPPAPSAVPTPGGLEAEDNAAEAALVVGHAYGYRLLVRGPLGRSLLTAAVVASYYRLPAAPQRVVATPGIDRIDLQWAPVLTACNGEPLSPAAPSYRIYRQSLEPVSEKTEETPTPTTAAAGDGGRDQGASVRSLREAVDAAGIALPLVPDQFRQLGVVTSGTERAAAGPKTFADTSLEGEGSYVYIVQGELAAGERRGLASPPARVEYVDKVAPAAPDGLIAVAARGRISLAWNRSASADAAGYLVYRARGRVTGAVGIDSFFLLTETPISGTTYEDPISGRGETYSYAIVAVDGAAVPNRSEPSRPASARSP